MSSANSMREKRQKREPLKVKKVLKAVFKEILDLPDDEKAYMMGYLLISPWDSTTYKRYRADGKVDTQAMTEWLNDRLRCYITDGKEGRKSIVDG